MEYLNWIEDLGAVRIFLSILPFIPEKAIFIFVDEVLPPTAALMSAIYEEHKFVVLRLKVADACSLCVIGTMTTSFM